MTPPLPLCDRPAYRPYIRWAGVLRLRIHRAPSRHRGQLSYLLHLVRGGRLVVSWDDGRSVELTARRSILLPPATEYVTRCTANVELASVHFTVDQNPLWRTMTPQSCFGLRSAEQRAMVQPSPEDVWGMDVGPELPSAAEALMAAGMPGMVEDWSSGDRMRHLGSHHKLAGLLLATVGDVARETGGEAPVSPEQRIRRAELAAGHNLHLGFGVNEMARAAGYDRSHFSTLYRKRRGRTAREFIEELRLDEARRLLATTDLPVSRIADYVGYAEHTAFDRMFRKATGTSPTAWRRAHRREPGG